VISSRVFINKKDEPFCSGFPPYWLKSRNADIRWQHIREQFEDISKSVDTHFERSPMVITKLRESSNSMITHFRFVVKIGLAYFLLAQTTPLMAQQWIRLGPSGQPPLARGFHGTTAVYAAPSNRMIVFGGRNIYGSNNNLNDVWVLTNANGLGASQWIQLNPTGAPPPSRSGHSAVYDSLNNRMIIFGGCNGGCLPALNDVWVLTNADGLGGTPTWAQLGPAGAAPSPRTRHTAVFDSNSNRMIVFAGQDGSGNGCSTFPEVWILNNANGLGGAASWSQLATSGGVPAGRYAPSSVYDRVNNRMIVFGGSGIVGGTCDNTNAVWTLSNANGLGGSSVWTNLIAEGAEGAPKPRAFHTAVYDSDTNRMTIFGANSSVLPNDAWVLRVANGLGGTTGWTRLSSALLPQAPAARASHAAILDPATKRMTIFGGDDGEAAFNTAWVLTNAVAKNDIP